MKKNNPLIFISSFIVLMFVCSNIYVDYVSQGTVSAINIIKYIIFVLPEIIFITLLTHESIEHNRRIFAIFLMYCSFIAYIAQCISIYAGSEMISTLAMENINMFYHLLANPKIILLLVISLISSAMLVIFMYKKFSTHKHGKHNKLLLIITICSIILLTCQNAVCNDNFKYPHTPLVSLFLNAIDASGVRGSRDLTAVSVKYPFLKKQVYQNPLPFNKVTKVARPNVIVFFMEGTSARVFGPEFKKKYPMLTPNIDKFIGESMSVLNYYNHTAATFRGLHGQLCSVWPYKGGWMGNNKGWGYEASELDKRSYASVPSILNTKGYQTVFFSPHLKKDPMTNMLNMLGFKSIYYAAKSLAAINEPAEKAMSSEWLYDKYNIESLVKYLQRHENDKTPLFIGLYNIETHTGVDTQPDGIKYGSGNNSVLDTIHNFDACFGKFYTYFKNSKYQKNTILILTADHCHYQDPIYVKTVSKASDYQPIFVDKIPLYIQAKFLKLPDKYTAGILTSASFASTVLHMLGIKSVDNNFMEKSIFDGIQKKNYGINYIGEYYLITNDGIYHESRIPSRWSSIFNKEKNRIDFFHACETEGRVFPISKTKLPPKQQ